jgi:hypothetical protein
MSELQGITAVARAPVNEVSLKPENQAPGTSLVSERNLFEYLAQQAQGNSLGASSVLANPAALANQASRHLRGFMERINQEAQVGWRKGQVMGSEKDGTLASAIVQAENTQLHPGPGREKLSSSQAGAERAEKVEKFSDQDYGYIIDIMARSMNFSIEANAVISGSANIMKSVQTLMRGQ